MYLGLSVISTLFTIMTMSILANIINVVFIGLWTWLLNYLCTIGYETVSWILVVFPILLGILIYLTATPAEKDEKTASPSATAGPSISASLTPTASPSPVPTK
uniref:Transmembrane protein n=2 Tax=viral metagenome TaxID=1070528 RepID=A0A6C0I5L9_9ZZZZ